MGIYYFKYLVNSFIFHTKEPEEILKSQNNKIWVQGNDDYYNNDYFGQFLVTIELQYQESNKVVIMLQATTEALIEHVHQTR